MIHFIYGASGYGKTHKITEMLKADAKNGCRSFLIVPEQQAVSSERMLLSALPSSAQLNLEVLNFSRLYNRVCREYGGIEYNYITKPAKYLLMWKNLRELSPLLEHYKTSRDTDKSLVEVMLSAVNEFKANNISPHRIEAVAEGMDKDSSLRLKLRDLSLVCSAYSAAVSEHFSDSSDDLSKLCDILREHNFFSGCNVYIDSFSSFTSAEHAVISEIFAQAENTVVTIPLPRPRYSSISTASVELSERKLIRNAERRGEYSVEVLQKNKRTSSAALAYLSENLWKIGEAAPADIKTDSIVLEKCLSPYDEAEAAARWCRYLMQSGMRCREIAVVTRDAETYRGIIEPAFERNDVPYFFSEKSDLCSKSAVKFLLSALRIKNLNWRASDVISHLKTGLYDIPQRSVDLFETYVNTCKINGNRFLDELWTTNPDGYTKEITERGKKILEAANEVRAFLGAHLIPLFVKLDAAANAAEACRALYEYLVECNVEQRLSDFAKKQAALGNSKEAEEYSSIFKVILDTLALTAEALEDSELSSTELLDALKLVFDTSDIGTIPTSADQVIIGSASMLRVDNPKCVLVLGLCEGEFPKRVSETSALNAPERTLLCELGIEFDSNSETRSSDELLFVSRAFSLPSEKLILFTAVTGTTGEAKQPSIPYLRVQKLLPNVKETCFDVNDFDLLSVSPQSAARYIYSQNQGYIAYNLRYALMKCLKDFSCSEDLLPPPISTLECEVSEETVNELFPKRMHLSQSRIEKYIKCNFNYYCSYVLGLREEKEREFRALEVGSFIHYVLESLIRAVVDANKQGSPFSSDQLTEVTEATVKKYIELLCPQNERATGRFAHLHRRLRNLALLLAKNISEEVSHSKFVPTMFEFPIEPLEFVLNDGSSVLVSGIIDRVDLFECDGRIFVRVVDYKTGTKSFSLDDLKVGLNTQMLIYLFSLCSSRSKKLFDGTPTPAGVLYLSSNIPLIELGEYTDADTVIQQAEKAINRSGLLLADEDILLAMNDKLSPDFLAGIKKTKTGLSGKALVNAEKFEYLKQEIEETITSIAQEMKSGKADASPLVRKGESPCDFCEMKPVCRNSKK